MCYVGIPRNCVSCGDIFLNPDRYDHKRPLCVIPYCTPEIAKRNRIVPDTVRWSVFSGRPDGTCNDCLGLTTQYPDSEASMANAQNASFPPERISVYGHPTEFGSTYAQDSNMSQEVSTSGWGEDPDFYTSRRVKRRYSKKAKRASSTAYDESATSESNAMSQVSIDRPIVDAHSVASSTEAGRASETQPRDLDERTTTLDRWTQRPAGAEQDVEITQACSSVNPTASSQTSNYVAMSDTRGGCEKEESALSSGLGERIPARTPEEKRRETWEAARRVRRALSRGDPEEIRLAEEHQKVIKADRLGTEKRYQERYYSEHRIELNAKARARRREQVAAADSNPLR